MGTVICHLPEGTELTTQCHRCVACLAKPFGRRRKSILLISSHNSIKSLRRRRVEQQPAEEKKMKKSFSKFSYL